MRRAGIARATPSEGPQTNRDLVLVVDDDEQMLKLIKRVLERAGFECVAVGDGHAAHDVPASNASPSATATPPMRPRSTGVPTSSCST